MGRTATKYNEADYYAEGTLANTFRKNFKAGRKTVETCDWNEGLMPVPEDGCDGVKDVFKK